MNKKTVLVTGATGNMGYQSLLQMKGDLKNYNIRLVARNSEKNHKILAEYEHLEGLEIVWGDLDDYEIVKKAVKGVDLILHIAAFVSPFADYYPKKAMIVNFGSTYNLIQAIKELHQNDTTYFVYIGTVAETGDRMPPIHWSRVGDPIKPSSLIIMPFLRWPPKDTSLNRVLIIGLLSAKQESLAKEWRRLKTPLCSIIA